jgi:hypothetical protein
LFLEQFVDPRGQLKKFVGIGFTRGLDAEGCYFLAEVHRFGFTWL